MSRQTKIAAIIAGIVIVALVGVFIASTQGNSDEPIAVDSQKESALMRPDARVLGDKGSSGVTFIEFLDFECEACGAAFPIVEDLREQYAGEVTFIARYFPLPGHFNAERAAWAVESAARQGKLEEMYRKMYETQSTWGEAQEPHDDLFRTFAEEIGLDMDQFDADYASEEVKARVQRDVDDGIELGVRGTPTFYLDGKPFEPQSVEDFSRAIDEALKK